MRLLDRYLLREFVVPLIYCLAGFFVFWLSFDLLGHLADYQKRGLSAAEILIVYQARTPELMVQVIPIALLLALLYALSNHARHHELIAMRAAGVSLARVSLPYYAVALLLGLAVFYLNEVVAPVRAIRADTPIGQRRLDFGRASNGRIWNIGSYDAETGTMRDVLISWKESDGTEHSVKAASAIWTNQHFQFFQVEDSVFLPGKSVLENPAPVQLAVWEPGDFTETPEQIHTELRVGALLQTTTAKEAGISIQELLAYLRLHPALSDADLAVLRTQLHARWAWPWTCLVVVAVALPFGVAPGRRNVFAGVAMSIFIAFGFFILLRLGLALGAGQRLHPVLAAWLPHAVFATLAIILGIRSR